MFHFQLFYLLLYLGFQSLWSHLAIATTTKTTAVTATATATAKYHEIKDINLQK